MTTATTTDTLARLRTAARYATPGPWQDKFPDVVAKDDRETIVCQVTGGPANQAARADAILIADCDPQTIIRLCDVIAAADKMRHMGSMHGTFNTIDLDAYDAARKALDER